jgi:NAD dependent epimerase/dehydratase family enzyme
MVVWAIENPQAEGFYNATSPNPVRNREFMRSLRRALHRPWSPPAPGPIVRFGSWLMGTEPELALKGRRVVPARLIEQGFTFSFPDLDLALREVLGK